jgi:hypothetical protein
MIKRESKDVIPKAERAAKSASIEGGTSAGHPMRRGLIRDRKEKSGNIKKKAPPAPSRHVS